MSNSKNEALIIIQHSFMMTIFSYRCFLVYIFTIKPEVISVKNGLLYFLVHTMDHRMKKLTHGKFFDSSSRKNKRKLPLFCQDQI